jgi:hypothetical protein
MLQQPHCILDLKFSTMKRSDPIGADLIGIPHHGPKL